MAFLKVATATEWESEQKTEQVNVNLQAEEKQEGNCKQMCMP